MNRILGWFKRFYCKHVYDTAYQEERIVLTEPWSSESGYKTQIRHIITCGACGRTRHVSGWKTIKRTEYGTGASI
jgi:hypothetical protein